MEEPRSATRPWQRLGRVAFYLVPLLVICALWLPVFRAYYVPRLAVSDEMLQQARESPSNDVLDELKDFDYLESRWNSQQQLIDDASALLHGELRFRGCSARLTMPFSPQDLDRVPGGCQLELAGFYVPQELLRAYEASHREEFLTAAAAVISQAQVYEQSAWVPRGAFWNDHAVASRVSVLAYFWRLYRQSSAYRPEVGKQVLQMVAHNEQLLARSDQFTYPTNHGIMQNLALWHATLAFPSLPKTAEYQDLASARMSGQMKFYVDDEGFVLEHSAGYQQFGVRLLGWTFRYLYLMHRQVPDDWIAKYAQARKVYATLRRPDGSLPMFGDTGDEADHDGPPALAFDQGSPSRLRFESDWKPVAATSLYPVSGYSVWWDGLDFPSDPAKLSQTVVAWSNFSGHGHKHADEMSVLFWAGGHNWWSNVGYWPYGSADRGAAESWAGSDAPHQIGESSDSPRTTKLLASGQSDQLLALDLERTGVGNYIARRQVIHCKPNLWIVLDVTSGSPGSPTTATWTSAPGINWQQRAEGWFSLEASDPGERLDLFVLGSQGLRQNMFRASSNPFAGWQVEGGEPLPASALVVEQPGGDSWSANIWSWQGTGPTAPVTAMPRMNRWVSATSWEIQLPSSAGMIELQREGDTLHLHSQKTPNATLQLAAPPDVGPQRAELSRQFADTAAQYHHFRGDEAKRKKVTLLLLGVFLLQVIFFVLCRGISAKNLDRLKYLNVMVWLAGGIWLTGFYF